jgi:hypothetical protein
LTYHDSNINNRTYPVYGNCGLKRKNRAAALGGCFGGHTAKGLAAQGVGGGAKIHKSGRLLISEPLGFFGTSLCEQALINDIRF